MALKDVYDILKNRLEYIHDTAANSHAILPRIEGTDDIKVAAEIGSDMANIGIAVREVLILLSRYMKGEQEL